MKQLLNTPRRSQFDETLRGIAWESLVLAEPTMKTVLNAFKPEAGSPEPEKENRKAQVVMTLLAAKGAGTDITTIALECEDPPVYDNCTCGVYGLQQCSVF